MDENNAMVMVKRNLRFLESENAMYLDGKCFVLCVPDPTLTPLLYTLYVTKPAVLGEVSSKERANFVNCVQETCLRGHSKYNLQNFSVL